MISSNSFVQSDIREVTSLIETSKVLFLQSYDIEFQFDNVITEATKQLKNYSPIFLQTNLALKSFSLFPFKIFFTNNPVNKLTYDPKQLVSDIVKDLTKSDTLANLSKSIIQGQGHEEANLITDEMNDVLVAVQRQCNVCSPLFVINSFYNFDENSKFLINIMLSGQLNQLYPILEKSKFIFVDTHFEHTEYQHVLLQDHKTYSLYKLTVEDVPPLLKSITAYDFSFHDSEIIYKLCGGQISKIAMLCTYLSNNEFEDYLYNNLEFKHFIFKILQNRLVQINESNTDIKMVLGFAAEIAEVVGKFGLEELKKVFNNEIEENVEKAIQYSDSEHFTKTESTISYFTHQIILDFFLVQNKDHRIASNLKIEQVVKYFRPGDFLYRAEYMEKADRTNEALVLCILQYIKESLNCSNPSEELVYRIMNLTEDLHLALFIPFQSFFEAYSRMDYYSAHTVLESNTTILNPKLLMAKYYLMGLSIKKLGASGTLVQESINLLKKVTSEENDEPYFSELAKSTLISLYTNYFGDKVKAKALFYDLIHCYSARQEHDPDAKRGLYVLYRKAAAVFSPEKAIGFTKESLEYFQNTIYHTQHLMSLNNHAANLTLLGMYDEAVGCLATALKLINSYASARNLPVCLLSNYIIVLTLSKKGNPEVVIPILQKQLDLLDDYDIKIIPLINIGISYALNGKYELAQVSLQHAKKIADPLDDDYFNYYVNSNFASLHFLLGNYDLALSMYLKDCLKPPSLISSSSRHLFDQRFDGMKSLFESRKALTHNEFQSSILSNVSETNRGDFYSRGFLFSDIQFWSES